MKKRLLFVISTYLFWLVLFLIFKSVFTIVHSNMDGGISVGDFFAVLYHGLKLDMSVSGYLTAIPLLVTIASLWVGSVSIKKILLVYFSIVAILLSFVFIIDFSIYPYWGFHIDSSIFLYLQTPGDAMASAPIGETIIGVIGFISIILAVVYLTKTRLLKQLDSFKKIKGKQIIKPLITFILLGGLIFLTIRGGVTASTMNVGQAYFSDRMYLNHAAINPYFNLLYSISKTEKFEKQYQFFEREKTEIIFEELTHKYPNNTISVLNTDRPNIVIVMLESFSAGAAYDSIVAPNLSAIAKEGINFSNFYANSFRTDRGIVSILSGYPAHPTVALMKYPNKTQSLPAIPKTLVNQGYNSAYYYGGDIDFASMRSYIVGACATKNLYGDTDFPIKTRLSKWGTPDEFVFDKVISDITNGDYSEPFVITIMTLSSHEPFDTPMEKVLEDPFLNSVHYTDKCIGEFMTKLKNSEYWDNTLVIFLADHCMQSFPEGASSNDPRRFHIPMIWSGGAIKDNKEIRTYGSQKDLAATLLGQLGIDYSQYKFSNNLLNNNEPQFGFYAYNNGFSMIDTTGIVIYDNDAKRVFTQEGEDLEEKAKAFFQTMYIDLGER